MKKTLTKKLVKWFEYEQKNYGTETALFNLIFNIASDLLAGIGIAEIRTRKFNQERKDWNTKYDEEM